MAHRTAPAQRAEDAEDQAVHMEQRQCVDEDVVGGPLPGVLQRVQGRGDRPPRQDGALGRAGGTRGVHDERGGFGEGSGNDGPAGLAAAVSTSNRSSAANAGGSTSPAAASTAAGALSAMMCASSRSPVFGFSGTAGTPARSAATTATTVCAVGVAHTATRPAPAIRVASASAASANCA